MVTKKQIVGVVLACALALCGGGYYYYGGDILPMADEDCTYYLSTTGDNGAAGTSVLTAWATMDYACGQLTTPGDTLCVLEGTYTGQQCVAQASGTSANPIVIRSLTGNATNTVFDGDSYINGGKICFNSAGYDFYKIDGFKILDYYRGVHMLNTEGWNISNGILTHTWYPAVSLGTSSTNCTIFNNTLYEVKWNFIQIGGGTPGTPSTYPKNMHIIGNEFYNNDEHGFVDLMVGFQHIYIEDNHFHDGPGAEGCYVHQTTTDGYPESGYIYFRNNTVYNCSYGVKFDDPANNSVIEGNTVSSLCGSPPVGRHIKIIDPPTHNVTCKDNDIWGDTYSSLIYGNTIDSLWEGNNITAGSGDYEFEFANGPNTITNHKLTGKAWFRVYNAGYSITVNFTDGRNFSVDGSGNYTTYTWSSVGLKNITIWGEAGGGGWTQSNTSIYYNSSNPILITLKTDGTHIFNPQPVESDAVISSFTMVVKTT